MHSTPDIADPVLDTLERERIPLQQELLHTVRALIEQARARYAGHPQIAEACDGLLELAQPGMEVGRLCKLRRTLYRLLLPEERDLVRNDIRGAAGQVQQSIDALRDISGIRLPERIITCRMRWCPEDPWYALRYAFDDPERTGTTGGPHIVLVRTPQRIDHDGQDLPVNFFLENGMLNEVEGRVHSECFFGDILEQLRCDCGPQLKQSMREINTRGIGVIFYIRQEGRGMGLHQKIDALELAEGREEGRWVGKTHDTASAMMAQGYASAELRQYGFIGPIVRGLGITQLHLMSHNPVKLRSLRDAGIDVRQIEAAGVAGGPENLTEFLWKIVEQNYENISARAILGELDKQLGRLARGKKIDGRLLGHLKKLLVLIETKQANHVDPTVRGVVEAHAHLLR